MQDSKLIIADNVRAKFPEVSVGSFICRQLKTARWQNLEMESIKTNVQSLVAQRARQYPDIVSLPEIARWREIYKNCNIKAGKFRSSIEQLFRRVEAGKFADIPLEFVNLYCLLSLKHMTPMGAYDLAKLDSKPIVLRYAEEGDHFEPIGGGQQFLLNSNVVVYANASQVLCWSFNCRDSKHSAVSEESNDIIIVCEAISADQHASAKAALEEAASLLRLVGCETSSIDWT